VLIQKQKNKIQMVRIKFLIMTLLIGSLLAAGTVIGGQVKADQFDAQINSLKQQNNGLQAQADSLAATAASYQQAINALAAQINSVQTNIVSTQNQIDALQKQIDQAQADLTQQKQVLGDNIRTMYLEGDITTLEVLASSRNLSDFVNKQEYRNSVGDKVKASVDKINALKQQLTKQQHDQQNLLATLQSQQNQLQAQENQQAQLLSYTDAQKSQYDQQISSNNSQIASLRAAQAATMAQRFSPGSGSTCGGGYPGVYCQAPQDSMIDSWGMYNRECVSYAAWAMAGKYGHYVPYGLGNANQWPSGAAARGIPEGSTPRVGSVAIWYVGAFGHAMVVDYVYGDGSFLVSQYNYSFNGTYSTMVVGPNSGFTFIYF
jgi:peptidoglycan DL-endopeptidase CwlO